MHKCPYIFHLDMCIIKVLITEFHAFTFCCGGTSFFVFLTCQRKCVKKLASGTFCPCDHNSFENKLKVCLNIHDEHLNWSKGQFVKKKIEPCLCLKSMTYGRGIFIYMFF